jgi:protein disulfide-isomerase A1
MEQITVESDRTVKALYRFLKKNAAIPFTLPRTRTTRSEVQTSESIQDIEEHAAYNVKDEL